MPFGHWWLLFPALCVGFLGGGVYVGAFTLLAQEQPSAYVELALSSASVADTFGMILASRSEGRGTHEERSLGFMVQGCIFGVMKVLDTAPDFTCGFDFWDTENSDADAMRRARTVSAPSFAKYCFPGVQG
ncbi:Protein BTN1 [Durusdinium trenchii]|uniref:Protein BTN1 n=1 Tax=Durusdinium trenchii TaxID=1381693 RepID=A0ABP0J2P0_9DINO